MRIAFLGDATHPNADSWIRALERQGGIQVHTWSLPPAGPNGSMLRRQASMVAAAARLRAWVRRSKPDLVIGYRTTSYGFLAAVTGFHPLVVAAQGDTDVWPPGSPLLPLKAFMARFCLRRADLIHAWGEHMRENLIALGAPPEKVLTLPRGIDVNRFSPPASRAPADELRLIVTRSLTPDYGHDVILAAVAAARGRGVPATLDVVGDGPSREPLGRLAAELGIGQEVRFLGRLSNDRLPELLRAAHVYVSMPVSEGVSASLLEAMASGCFPVVSDLQANRRWITPDDNGLLVPVGDASTLAAMIERLWQSPAWREEVARRNRALVEREGSLEQNVARFTAAYRRLVAGQQALV